MPFCPICQGEFVKEKEVCPECYVKLVEQLEEPIEIGDVKEIYECDNRMEAERIKGILGDHNIDCNFRVLESSSFPLGAQVMSAVRLVVTNDNIDRSIEIIEESIDNEIISDKGCFID